MSTLTPILITELGTCSLIPHRTHGSTRLGSVNAVPADMTLKDLQLSIRYRRSSR